MRLSRAMISQVLFFSALALNAADAPAPEPEFDLHKGVMGITFKPGPAEADPKYKRIEDSLRGSLKRAVSTPLISDVKIEQVEKGGTELQKDAEEKKVGWVFDLTATFAIVKKGKDKEGNATFTVSCQLEQTVYIREKNAWKAVLTKSKPAPVTADTPGPVAMTNPLAEPLHDALVPMKVGTITKRDQPRDKGNYSAMHIYTVAFTVTNKTPIEIANPYPLLYAMPKKPQAGAPPTLQMVGVSKVTPITLKPGATATVEAIVEGYIVDEQFVWPPQKVVSSTTTKF